MHRSRISSIDVGVGKLLLVKYNQALSNWIKKSSFFSFWAKYHVLQIRICFCLKRAWPWDLSRENWWDLITFKSIFFSEKLIECLCLKYLVHPLKLESWAMRLGGYFFPFQRKTYILLISFLIYFGIVYIWPICHSLDKRICFTIIFLSPKESLTLFQIRIFLLQLHWFCPNWS